MGFTLGVASVATTFFTVTFHNSWVFAFMGVIVLMTGGTFSYVTWHRYRRIPTRDRQTSST